MLLILLPDRDKQTCGNQSKLVFLVCDLLLLDISSREEKSHHPLEELVHELDGERHHVHLTMTTEETNLKLKTRI